MINDPTRVYDGYSNLVSGVDDGRRPNLLDQNQCASAENVMFRGGSPQQRLPWKDLPIIFENGFLTYTDDGDFFADPGPNAQGQNRFQYGLFQEASYFAPRDGAEFIQVSIAGRYYQLTPGLNSASVREIPLARRNRSDIPISYHLQAGKYHIVQDGEAQPIIFDGTIARRAGANEIFTGKMMGYGQGRIVLVGVDNQIYFGDIRDGMGNGDADLLNFTETQFLNEGSPSALPSGMGVPTAVQFIPQQDTATGVGECLVFGQHGVESFLLSAPRDQWKNITFQTTALLGIGAPGHRCVTPINEDVWFRSNDGFRSYRQARAQVNQYAQIPESTNISKWIGSDTESLLQYSSVINFNQRMLATVAPYPNATGSLYHNALVSLDFDILSTFGRLTEPAWDGSWTEPTANPYQGARIMQVVSGIFGGIERCFAFYQTGPVTRLLEIGPKPTGKDTDLVGRKINVTSRLFTRSMDFQSEFNEKTLYGGDIWADQVEEDNTPVTVTYRPDQYPVYVPWAQISFNSINGITEGDATISATGFSPRKSLKKPGNEGDTLSTKRILRRGYEFQVGLEWTGRAALRKLRLHAKTELEDAKAKV